MDKIISFSLLSRYGRLGNALFQFASTMGIAEKHGAAAVFPEWPYEKYFETVTPHGEMQRHRLNEKHFHHYDWNIEGNCDLCGYMQSEKYFGSTKLKLKQEYLDEVREPYKNLFNGETICIHIRRGDYVCNENYINISILWYINVLMDKFPTWRNSNILIFSDDPEYTRIHFECLPNATIISGNSDIYDMALASQCDHFILSNSSYSWWMAWLGEKPHSKIIHYGEIFAGVLAKKNDSRDFYPERWIRYRKDRYNLDLMDTTFTIPVFKDHDDRKHNLDLSLCILQQSFDSNYIIYEQGGSSFVYTSKWANYKQFTSPLFHRTKMLNDMAIEAATDYIVNWDCDVIIAPLQIYMGVEALRNGANMVFPYDGRFAQMPRMKWFPIIQKTLDIGNAKDVFPGQEKDRNSVGGAVMFNKESFIEGGMENENMVSFGPEDCERNVRFTKLGYKIGRIQGNLFHMDHYVGVNSSSRNPHFKENYRELERIREMSKEELIEYINTWSWRNPYTGKYYHNISEGSIRSAESVMKSLYLFDFKPMKVIDIGAGVGEWNNNDQSSHRTSEQSVANTGGIKMNVYSEKWRESALLDGWQEAADEHAVGDFLGLGHDQVMYWNRDPQGGSGRVMIVDYSGGVVPGQQRYLERWGESALLDGWQEAADEHAVGDFLGLGHDQVMYWNRDPQGGSGRVMIVDYSSGVVPGQQRYLERWGESALLDGWQEAADEHAVGDFLGLGHDQVMYWNRDPQGGSGRVMIVDYSGGVVPGQQRYLERWGESALLDGWQEAADEHAVGDFLGLGHDQVMYWNRDPQGGSGRVMIVDYSGGVVPGQQRYLERWGESALLDGWQEAADEHAVGDFLGLGHDQVMYWNRDPQGGSGRVMIVDYSGGVVLGQQRYLERWGESALLDGWQEAADEHAVGDFLEPGHDQVMYWNRDPQGGSGRVMIVDYSGGVVPGQQVYLERWGESALLDGWEDEADQHAMGDYPYDTGVPHAVALDDEGNVVEVHEDEADQHAMGDYPYDTGVPHAVALDYRGNVVEVHVAADRLFYRVGEVDYTNKGVAWGDSYEYDTGGSNAVAIDDEVDGKGNVVEVHVAADRLFYRVGKVDFANKGIAWGDSYEYDTGGSNAVAIDDEVNGEGNVVEVHSSIDRLFYRVGKVDFANKRIAWGDSYEYDTGGSNAVALDNKSNVVEVHSSIDRLFYRVGKVDFANKRIAWGDSYEYDTGGSNAVAIDDEVNGEGNVVEVHSSIDRLFYRVGKVDFANKRIAWGDSYEYDTGGSNAVALDWEGNVVEVHSSIDRLFHRVGKVDYTNKRIAWEPSI